MGELLELVELQDAKWRLYSLLLRRKMYPTQPEHLLSDSDLSLLDHLGEDKNIHQHVHRLIDEQKKNMGIG